jgi:hypothetical protein
VISSLTSWSIRQVPNLPTSLDMPMGCSDAIFLRTNDGVVKASHVHFELIALERRRLSTHTKILIPEPAEISLL